MNGTLHNVLAAISLSETDALMILVGTGLIFTLYKSLQILVFQPLLEHVEHRETVTEGALFTAEQMRQKALALRSRYDEAMFQARVEANRTRTDIIAEAKSQASQIISAAEAEAAADLKAGRAAIADQLSHAKQSAEREATVLAATLASQVDSQLSAQ
jgi:F0F1-type ATP synthase membrane subunit b/b'